MDSAYGVKRVEKHYFKWPESCEEGIAIVQKQMRWLFAGFDYTCAHER
ncbi:IS66 family insertion sequence element accessory protein TnpB [uncultured Desulfobacter sp.]|nr:hypothetical protein [uncultured Desulfobacter sp.]